MRLTPEEIQELTTYLVSSLTRKRFFVNTNRYGNILYAEKFGIRCCPAILNSTEDGRQGYAYIQLITNPYSEKDLGSYYKPRTNKSNHKLFDKNSSIDKYSGKDVHIDTHNYKQVINTFILDLSKDYNRIVSKTEDLELDVDVSATGTCIWKPNFRVWNISADNLILKDSIYPYIETSNVVDDIMNRGWLLKIEHNTLSGNSIMVAVGQDEENYPKSYHFFGYISPKNYNTVATLIREWMQANTKQYMVVESVVKIKNTGTVFDGMTGTVEQDDGNKLTVLVDFNNEHKVRNKFKKEQIEILED